MKSSIIFFTICGLLIGLIIGFWSANVFSRSGYNATQISVSPKDNNETDESIDQNTKGELSEEEINQILLQIKSNNTNLEFKKKLGLALFKYAKAQNDVKTTSELESILLDVSKKQNDQDLEVLLAVGEITFTKGKISESQEIFKKAVKLNPKSIDAGVSLGSTYLISNPPDVKSAISILEETNKQNPKNEIVLQYLITALIKGNNNKEAERHLLELKDINPKNEALADLEIQLNQRQLSNQN